MASVLIFGANGFVGPYLAQEFASSRYCVYASDVSDVPKSELRCEEYIQCDLLDAEGIYQAVDTVRPDILVNLAAISSVGQSWHMPQKTIEVNVLGTLNLLEAARLQATVPRILLVGSSEEYAPSSEPLNEESPLAAGNPYGISKAGQGRFADLYAQQYDMRIYRTRSFNHTGVGQSDAFVLPSWCKQAAEIEAGRSSAVMKVGNLSVCRDFTDVRDVVRAYRLLVESDFSGEVFNVGSGRAKPLERLLKTITGYCSCTIDVEVEPQYLRPTDNPVICCDYSKASKLLGWEPEYQIEETLAEMFDAYFKSIKRQTRE